MTRRIARIAIAVPASAERRDAIERAVFDQLDAHRAALAVPATADRRDRVERGVFDQLAGIRGAERADAAVATRARRRWVPVLAFAGAAAVAVAIVIGVRGDRAEPAPTTSSLIVVPPGQTTRFTEGDVIVVAGGDTSVEVSRGVGVTLALARGSVDCNVPPRGDRPAFRVVAGDVDVEVVGTHFSVSHGATGVRVDVTHGKVRVTSPRGESFVTAGETWSSTPPITAQAPPPPPPPPVLDEPVLEEIELEAVGAPSIDATRPAWSERDAYKRAKQLEPKDPDGAAREYRRVASAGRTLGPLALFDLAELEQRRGRSDAALRVLDEYVRRFPRAGNAEDALWMRIEIHRSANRSAAMRAAAAEYLRQFPRGTYAKQAERFARP